MSSSSSSPSSGDGGSFATIYHATAGTAPRKSKGSAETPSKTKPELKMSEIPRVKSVFAPNVFQGKIALVTGGGTGIGLRTARELASLGAVVVLASRKLENLNLAVELIEKESPNGDQKRAYAVQCNVREEESIRACVQQTLELVGRIDFLVNNAGGQFMCPAENISWKGWKAVIETNLTGIFFMAKTVFELAFAKQKNGAIVNVIANMWNGFPMMSHTGAARAGVDNLTKTLATEWGRCGVRINSVAPGIIASTGLSNYGAPAKELILSSASRFNQTNRLGTEEEVAASIIFLLTPASSFITGETIKVDGAESLYSPLMPPDAEHTTSQPWKDASSPAARL